MRILKFIFAVFPLVGCYSFTPEIIHKDYEYEKIFLGNYRFTFEFSFENITNSDKTANLIEKLIYQNRSFDEYIEYAENKFIGTINMNKGNYPRMIEEDGTEYFYHSDLVERYKIEYCNNLFAIISYNNYSYYSGAAHGGYWTEYFIIDLTEEKILEIDELLNPISDGILIELIKTNSDINDYLRDNIWPPDSINFRRNKIILVWNTYTITPYALGIIYIELQDDVIELYLTEKGKKIRTIMNK
jgi:hypothetical protein